MDNETLDFIQENLKYLGFGDKIVPPDQLEQELAKAPKDFELYAEAYYDDDYKLEAVLHFRKWNDLYFFNKYDALLRKGDDPEMDRRQTFYISKGTGVTMKECFNLLQGRAVNKDLINIEGEKYNAWIHLNFDDVDLNHNYRMKQYRSQYGYDLEKILEKYPIRELKNEESKTWLIKALKRGNLQPVDFLKSDNKTEKMFIEASPQNKTINIYPSTRAAQKTFKKPDRIPNEGIKPKPGTSEGAEEETTTIEEGKEEGIETPLNKPTVRKKGAVNKIQ